MSNQISKSEELNKYLKEIGKTVQNINKSIVPILQRNNRFFETLHPMIEAQNNLAKKLEPILQQYHKLAENIRFPSEIIESIAKISQPTIDFQKYIHNIISLLLIQVIKSIEELPEKTKKALISLGSEGWFLDLEMPMSNLWLLQKAIESGDFEDIENELIKYFEMRIDDIESAMIERFPHREKIIKAAFKAHRNEEFELSIPVLLAQVDGICYEVIQYHYFMKKDRKPKTALYVEKIATDTYKAALLSPLTQTLPISASKWERDEKFNQLNRHMILHGESCDYGIKKNSSKAISLLNYIVQVLRDI